MCHLCCCTCAYELMLPSEGHPHTVHPTCHCQTHIVHSLSQVNYVQAHEPLFFQNSWMYNTLVWGPCRPSPLHTCICNSTLDSTSPHHPLSMLPIINGQHFWSFGTAIFVTITSTLQFQSSKLTMNQFRPMSSQHVARPCAYKSMAHTFPTPSLTTKSFAAFKRWLSSFRKFIVWHSKVPKCIVDV